MKTIQKQNSKEKGNSIYVLFKISKKPQNQFEIIQEALKKDGTNCEEGKRMNCKREQIEEKRNFSKEERLEMIEKRINFLKQKLEKIEPNDPRKQRIEAKSHFFQKKERISKRESKKTTNHPPTNQENNLI